MSERPNPTRAVREVTSFRLPSGTIERLDARARALGTTRTTLAERLLEEGLRLVEHPGITFRDGPAGRRAGIAGSGLDVWEIVQTIRASDGSLDDAAEYLAVAPSRIQVAARYYAAYPDEIDEWIAENDAVFERESRLAAEQRRRLG
jgi:uncharacterized protein (DUF433 family)